MSNIVIASDDLVVLGGPASVRVELDIGATGVRGSQIFTDAGKPTSPSIQFPVPPQINDLYINLDPSDLEYLFLYQYKLDNAVLGWTKLLRLIPTTILFNPTLKFINGEAHTSVTLPEEYDSATVDVRGLYFPITGTLENENIENLDYRDLNLQYEIISPKPSFGGADLKEINSVFDIEYFNPITQEYDEYENFPFGARYLYATLKLVEINDDLELNLVTGYRKLDMVLTIAGRAESVIDIFAVNVANPAISSPGSLTISNHGMIQGSRFGYLSNGKTKTLTISAVTAASSPSPGSITITAHKFAVGTKLVYSSNDGGTAISGLSSGQTYYVASIVDENKVILSDGENVVILPSSSFTGTHTMTTADVIVGLVDQADYYVAQVIDANNVVITQDGVNPVTFLSNTKVGIHSIVKAGAVL
jgi:hypothetical protein